MYMHKIIWEEVDWHIAAARVLGVLKQARLDERSNVESLFPDYFVHLHKLSLLVPEWYTWRMLTES